MNIELKIASLYSGGKDSTFSIFKCLQYGHEVACLITLHPSADDSLLFHYPNSWITKHIARAMCKPLIELEIPGISCKENEYNALTEAVVPSKVNL